MAESQTESLLGNENNHTNGGGGSSSYLSLEEEGNETKEASSEPPATFADGFVSWDDSYQALYLALFHVGVYLGIGILFYSFLLPARFTVLDSIYFSVAVVTTVGYGDISADGSNYGMLFSVFFAIYGIVILGIFLGILGDMAIERQERLQCLATKRLSVNYMDTMLTRSSRSGGAAAATTSPEDNNNNPNEEEMDSESIFRSSFIQDIYGIVKEQHRNLALMLVLAIPVVVMEGWSIVEGLYWLVITGTTIGLGDRSPDHEISKLYCIFYIPMAVAFGGAFVGRIATSYVDRRNDALEAQFLSRALSESDISAMDTNRDNMVHKDEFLVYMLKTLGHVEQEDMDRILELFDQLDKNGSGSLTKDDIRFIPNQTAVLHSQSVRSIQGSRSSNGSSALMGLRESWIPGNI